MRPIWIKGVDLTQTQKLLALARYIYRFTGDHQPNWVLPIHHYWEQGGLWTHYFEAKPEFCSDAEWFERCEFPTNKDGSFAPCYFQPRTIKYTNHALPKL